MQIRDVECRNQRLQWPKKMGTGLKDYSVLNLAINGIDVLWYKEKKLGVA